MQFVGRKKHRDFSKRASDLSFDEVLFDAGRSALDEGESAPSIFERPFTRASFYVLGFVIVVVLGILVGRTIWLGGVEGNGYAARSEENRIERQVVEADRGVIYDRHGVPLVRNTWDEELDRSVREAVHTQAFSHVLGYVGRPDEDDLVANAALIDYRSVGRNGIEEEYDDILRGEVGELLQEVDARGDIVSQGFAVAPSPGENITLTLDKALQEKTYDALGTVIDERGFVGGAAVLFNPTDGEIFSLVSYPSFNINAFSRGISQEEFSRLINSSRTPLFNRAISGRYQPGSIMKPYFALAGLAEGAIDEDDQVFSSGAITIPNPYDPSNPTIFRDWKAHGWVDVRKALAVSSNVFFYAIGGGYEQIEGVGVDVLRSWLERFRLSERTGIDIPGEVRGFLPDPALKEERHPNDPVWRIGDTYHASIGQGDTAITPVAAAAALAGLATHDTIPTLHVLQSPKRTDKNFIKYDVDIPEDALRIVYDGMEMGVSEGTASAIANINLPIRGKTGTAEFGRRDRVHSWFTGFTYFPDTDEQLGMVIFLESGPRTNLVGGVSVAFDIFRWIEQNGGVQGIYHGRE